MPIYKLSGADYATIMASERHHFIHMNGTSHTHDKAHYHMSFSKHVARMLFEELGIETEEINRHVEEKLKCNHPEDAHIVPHDELHRCALHAPGHNHPKD